MLVTHLPQQSSGFAGFILYAVMRFVWRQIRRAYCFFSSRTRALRAVRRERTEAGVREGTGVWFSETSSPPPSYKAKLGRPPVLVVANNKGGVGKTTISANLGACWATKWKKQVLLVDLDYQGTLSAMALRSGNWLPPKGQDSLATRMVSGDLDPGLFVSCSKEVGNAPSLRVIPAYYDLAQADNRLVIEWLLRCRPAKSTSGFEYSKDLLIGDAFRKRDIRYTLARLLQTEAVEEAFDVVIIDCPPRLTTGTVQALCAGSKLLVPTVLDTPSSEAVIAFLREIEGLKEAKICEYLEYIGIIGVKTSRNVDQIAEASAKQLIVDQLRDHNISTGLLNDQYFLRQSTALLNYSEEGIAYLSPQAPAIMKEEVERIATYVASQCGIPAPPDYNNEVP